MMKNYDIQPLLEYLSQLKTPSIVYDKNLLHMNIHKLLKLKESISNLSLYYAMKANSDPIINEELSKYIDGADVASIQEYELAISSGYKNIVFNSPALPIKYLHDNISENTTICVSSISQLKQFDLQILKNNKIGLRINHSLDKYNSSFLGSDSRFGINYDDPKLLDYVNENNLDIEMLHIHLGEKNIENISEMFNLLDSVVSKSIFKNIKKIDIGGGIYNIVSNKREYKKFAETLKEFCNKYRNLDIIIEPGQALVMTSGLMISSVLSADISKKGNNIVLDCSAHNLISWIQPRILSTTSNSKKSSKHYIYGNTCYELDIFANGYYTNNLRVKDKVIFFPMGAYMKGNSRSLHMFEYPETYYHGFKQEEANAFENQDD